MGLNNKSIILKRNRLIAYGLLMISPFLSFGIAVRNWKTDYAKNILIGVAGSFVFALISVAFYFIITYGNYSIKIKVEQPTENVKNNTLKNNTK